MIPKKIKNRKVNKMKKVWFKAANYSSASRNGWIEMYVSGIREVREYLKGASIGGDLKKVTLKEWKMYGGRLANTESLVYFGAKKPE